MYIVIKSGYPVGTKPPALVKAVVAHWGLFLAQRTNNMIITDIRITTLNFLFSKHSRPMESIVLKLNSDEIHNPKDK
ncbi:MAG TPA: hypothetical protein VK668_12460 [Mucilaginibacter sp.]|nr:hypothetical protein [Mucilaginibacter sp.]